MESAAKSVTASVPATPAFNMDQARVNAVVGQRNNALNAAAHLEALVEALSADNEAKRSEIDALKKELDDLKAKYLTPTGAPDAQPSGTSAADCAAEPSHA